MEEKEHKLRKLLIKVFCLLFGIALVLFCVLIGMRKTFAGRRVESINAEAKCCMNGVAAHIDDVFKAEKKTVPANREFYIRGRRSTAEPCELLEHGAKIKYLSADNDIYWIVKYKDGKPCEAWSAIRPIKESELKYYTKDEQVGLIKNHIFKGEKLIVGYYNDEKGERYYH